MFIRIIERYNRILHMIITSCKICKLLFKYISNFYPRLHNDKEQSSLANVTRVKHKDMCCKPSKGQKTEKLIHSEKGWSRHPCFSSSQDGIYLTLPRRIQELNFHMRLRCIMRLTVFQATHASMRTSTRPRRRKLPTRKFLVLKREYQPYKGRFLFV